MEDKSLMKGSERSDMLAFHRRRRSKIEPTSVEHDAAAAAAAAAA